MSKNKSKRHTTSQRPEREQEALTPAQKVAREDLGDFAGITMGEGKASATQPSGALDGSDDRLGEVLLAVDEDRPRLVAAGIGFLLLAFFGLFLILGGIGATNISQNVAYLVLILVGLPVAWFSSKAMGRRLGKFARHVGVVDFCERGVRVYGSSSDAKQVLSVAYKDIKAYRLIRQGRALRLLLSGKWVKHPSGYYLVDINRPFMADTLDGLEGQIHEVLSAHRVRQAKN